MENGCNSDPLDVAVAVAQAMEQTSETDPKTEPWSSFLGTATIEMPATFLPTLDHQTGAPSAAAASATPVDTVMDPLDTSCFSLLPSSSSTSSASSSVHNAPAAAAAAGGFNLPEFSIDQKWWPQQHQHQQQQQQLMHPHQTTPTTTTTHTANENGMLLPPTPPVESPAQQQQQQPPFPPWFGVQFTNAPSNSISTTTAAAPAAAAGTASSSSNSGGGGLLPPPAEPSPPPSVEAQYATIPFCYFPQQLQHPGGGAGAGAVKPSRGRRKSSPSRPYRRRTSSQPSVASVVSLSAHEPVAHMINGIEHITFLYSHDRLVKEYTVRTDVEQVNLDDIPLEFRVLNAVRKKKAFFLLFDDEEKRF